MIKAMLDDTDKQAKTHAWTRQANMPRCN